LGWCKRIHLAGGSKETHAPGPFRSKRRAHAWQSNLQWTTPKDGWKEKGITFREGRRGIELHARIGRCRLSWTVICEHTGKGYLLRQRRQRGRINAGESAPKYRPWKRGSKKMEGGKGVSQCCHVVWKKGGMTRKEGGGGCSSINVCPRRAVKRGRPKRSQEFLIDPSQIINACLRLRLVVESWREPPLSRG